MDCIAIMRALRDDQKGVTALEYGILASVLGLVLATMFSRFGTTMSTLFSHVSSSI